MTTVKLSSSFPVVPPIDTLLMSISHKRFQFVSSVTNYLTLDSIPVDFALNHTIFRDNAMKYRNNVKKIREERLMSKAELARLAGVSPATIERIERGEECRMETKRKILLALGFSLSEKDAVFID